MGRITGMDYRNGLLYAVLSASNVFYRHRFAYSSPREWLVRETCSLCNTNIAFLHRCLEMRVCLWGGGEGVTGSVSWLKDRKTLSARYICRCGLCEV